MLIFRHFPESIEDKQNGERFERVCAVVRWSFQDRYSKVDGGGVYKVDAIPEENNSVAI